MPQEAIKSNPSLYRGRGLQPGGTVPIANFFVLPGFRIESDVSPFHRHYAEALRNVAPDRPLAMDANGKQVASGYGMYDDMKANDPLYYLGPDEETLRQQWFQRLARRIENKHYLETAVGEAEKPDAFFQKMILARVELPRSITVNDYYTQIAERAAKRLGKFAQCGHIITLPGNADERSTFAEKRIRVGGFSGSLFDYYACAHELTVGAESPVPVLAVDWGCGWNNRHPNVLMQRIQNLVEGLPDKSMVMGAIDCTQGDALVGAYGYRYARLGLATVLHALPIYRKIQPDFDPRNYTAKVVFDRSNKEMTAVSVVVTNVKDENEIYFIEDNNKPAYPYLMGLARNRKIRSEYNIRNSTASGSDLSLLSFTR